MPLPLSRWTGRSNKKARFRCESHYSAFYLAELGQHSCLAFSPLPLNWPGFLNKIEIPGWKFADEEINLKFGVKHQSWFKVKTTN